MRRQLLALLKSTDRSLEALGRAIIVAPRNDLMRVHRAFVTTRQAGTANVSD